jgi:pseudouridine synthase
MKAATPKKKTPKADADSGAIRLQLVLSRAGVASRRKAEDLIVAGRVRVNGKVVTQLGTKVDPSESAIKVDGKLLGAAPQRPVYLLMNKPRGVLTAAVDADGRPVVTQLIRGIRQRVFPVGRLDLDTEGLLLLTNDGELAHKLTHPSFGVPRTYHAKVSGKPDARTLERMRKGVRLEDGPSGPARVRFVKPTDTNAWLEITVSEGRNRLIRRLCQAVGHPVSKLKRVSYGGLKLRGLSPGGWRELTDSEVAWLRKAVKDSSRKSRKGGTSARPGNPRPVQR